VERFDHELNRILGQQDRSKHCRQTWRVTDETATRRSQEPRFIQLESNDAKNVSPCQSPRCWESFAKQSKRLSTTQGHVRSRLAESPRLHQHVHRTVESCRSKQGRNIVQGTI
jgi:hypothetical protein